MKKVEGRGYPFQPANPQTFQRFGVFSSDLLFFQTLANSFALNKNSTLFFSISSELFAKNHPGWGEGPFFLAKNSHDRLARTLSGLLSLFFLNIPTFNIPTFGFPYTLPSSVCRNSFVCHSYENTGVWGYSSHFGTRPALQTARCTSLFALCETRRQFHNDLGASR